jgi:acetyltransferase
MERYRKLRARPRLIPDEIRVDDEQARLVLSKAGTGPDGFLSPADAGELLSAYGIPLSGEQRSKNWEGVKNAAAEVGYPVVLKAESSRLIHKTDAGAVILDIGSESELKESFDRLNKRVGSSPDLIYLIQPQLDPGLEIIIGGSRAKGLGGMVMFGLGGIHVDVFKDVVFKLVPLDRSESEEMLNGIRAAALLDGVRGRPGIDKGCVTDILMKISELMRRHPEIAELDLNPVLAYEPGKKPVVVDYRIKIEPVVSEG